MPTIREAGRSEYRRLTLAKSGPESFAGMKNRSELEMLDDKTRQQFDTMVLTSQIILAAMVMGVVMFGGIVVFAMPGGEGVEGNILSMLAVIVGGANLVLCLVVPGFIAAANRRKIAAGVWQSANRQPKEPPTDFGKLTMVYQMKMIVGAALLEGGCFLALIAYMIEGQMPSLVVAAVLLAALLAHFPTRGRVEAWIEDQLRRVKEERQFSL
jgi:hypothetical protein